MKLVQFSDGTYGVYKLDLPWFVKRFLDPEGDWWHTPEFIWKYCRFKTEDEAVTAAQKAKGTFKVLRSL